LFHFIHFLSGTLNSFQNNRCENIFVIQRLSTDGFSYLTALRKPNAKEKLIGFAKENGIAPTLQNMSKFAAQLFFD